MSKQLSFSGHQTFTCKQFWLKKGYEFIKNNKKFSDKNAVVELGVGKNMVASINFWLKAFGLFENENLSEISHLIFDNQIGKDIYLEDINTIWLLHYLLIKTEKASIYNIFFNEFLKEKPEFTKEQLKNWIIKYIEGKNTESTIQSDVEVLLRMYQKPKKTKTTSKDFMNLFVSLELLRGNEREREDKKINFNINEKNSLSSDIFLFAILDNPLFEHTNSISLKDLRFAQNSVGLIFGLTYDGVYNKIQQLIEKYPENIVFTETAGNSVLQFKVKPNKMQVLENYYNN